MATRILTPGSIVTFGKYKTKGYTVSKIQNIDPQYIEWLESEDIIRIDREPNYMIAYLASHPNPFNLNPRELEIAVRSSYVQIKIKGNPQEKDWDKEIKYSEESRLEVTQPNRNLYGTA